MNNDSERNDSVGGASTVGAVGDAVAGIKWTDEDELWVKQVPPHFQPAARRHGRDLFCYIMLGNNAGVALNKLTQRLRGNRELMTCIDILTQTVNEMSKTVFVQSGWTQTQVQEVHQDAARAAQLANIGSDQRTNGGIIIAH